MIEHPDSRVDFAMGEALAFGALALHRGAGPALPDDESSLQRSNGLLAKDDASKGLNRGSYAIRLTGQDSERGTFNQRHAVLYDQITGARYGTAPEPCVYTCTRTHTHMYMHARTYPQLHT